MKVVNLNEGGEKSDIKTIRPLAMERNPKENLFAILAKNYFKIHRLTDENKFIENKIITKKNNVKLNYVHMTWDPNKKDVLYFIANPISSSTHKKVSNTNLYSIDLQKNSIITEEFKFDNNITHLSMNCSQNKSILAYCSKDDNIGLLDLKDKNIISTITKKNLGIIYDCKFSPFNENLLLFSAETGKIYLYDIRNISKSVHNYCIESKEILSISWHPSNSKIFCSGSMDNSIRIWDIDNDNSSIASFKTSRGCSKVTFLKSNPNYIMSSYQTDNYNIHLWNLKLRDIPEYQFSGHLTNVIGFDNDVEGKRLISCDKKGQLIINELNKGLRILDNITTNIIKFNNNNEVYCFHDVKLKKENIFEFDNNNNNKDNSHIIEKKFTDELELFNKENDNIKNIYMMNFNQQELQLKNKIIEKEDKKINLKNDITLNINNELKQYYIFSKEQINNLFRRYIYYIERKETLYTRKRFSSDPHLFKIESSDDNENNIDELDFSDKLIRAISANLEYAKNVLNNYNHVSIWNTLQYMANQPVFRQLYDIYSGKEQKKKKKRKKKNNKQNKSFEKDKQLYDFKNYRNQINKSSPLTYKFMANLMIKQISRIIEYLIDDYGDIYLATTICYLFKPILFKDEKLKPRLLRLIKECINNIRKYQLYVIANHLLKYGPEENNITNEKNEFKFSCRDCKKFEFKEGKCNCGKILLCEECHKKTIGLFFWCSGCGHGGHLNHIIKTVNNFSCKGCGHHCL